MRAIFEIVMSPCDVMYPKFWINEICKKKMEIWRKESNSYFGKYITYFQNIAKIWDIFSKVGCKVWQSDDPKLEIVSGTGRS